VQIDGAYDHAEDIGWDESQLRCAESYNTHDDAVDTGQCPAFPIAAPDENRGRNSQGARKIIKTKHV
jgi:hypothetical protein